MSAKYVLLDTNVTAAYYLPLCTTSKKTRERVEVLFDSVRSGKSPFFFYLPNFCVAEVFGVFMKYAYAKWNNHVASAGTIDRRVYGSLVDQFAADIHNGQFIYHYELSRYHVLGINLVAPVDHYFQISRAKKSKAGSAKKKSANVRPAGTFDHLIISMGIHLAKIHGAENVVLVSADDRLIDVISKCKSKMPEATKRKLRLDKAEDLTGIAFAPEAFPQHVNLKSASTTELASAFGQWPLPVGDVRGVYRWTRT